MKRFCAILMAGALLAGAACGDDDDTAQAGKIDPGDGGAYAPAIDPANFVDAIDNPYMPLRPGSKWVYEGTSDGETERIVVSVTDQRRMVGGISAVVVRDTVHIDGELHEDTYDWFAQDRDGNVWYLGEESKEYEDGKVSSTEGSWEYGVNGALPGIIMPAAPKPGQAYRQEFLKGEAEDLGEVIRTDATRKVKAGSYQDVLVVREWNPFEPEVVEEKSYAKGVGKIFEEHTEGEEGSAELIEFTPGT